MKSLKTKMIAYILPAFLLIFSFVLIYSYNYSKKLIITTRYAELSNFVKGEKYRIVGWFDSNQKILDTVKSSIENSGMPVDKELSYMGKIIKDSNGDISDIYIGTTDGVMIDGSGWTPPADYDPRKRGWYSDGMKVDKVTYGKPYLDMVTGKMAVSAAAKVNNPDGTLRGVISGDLILETISKNIESIKFGETGYAYIVDKEDGTVVAHSLKKEYIGKKVVEISPDLSELQNTLISQDEGITSYKVEGDTKFVAYSSIPSLKWNLAVVISEKEVLANLTKYKYSMYIVIFISIILVSLLVERISASIIKPVKTLVAKVLEISEGNLGTKIDVKGNDEISLLSKEFNSFVERLRDSMDKIKKLVGQTKTSNDNVKKSIDNIINGQNSSYYNSLSEKISRGIIQLNEQTEVVLDNVRDQTASSEESLAALEEISSTAQHMNQNIILTAKSFEKSLEISKNSTKDINKMSISMGEITESVNETNEEIDKLKDISNNIGQIIVSINGVAEQTNLLALNAAIEAARAGEAGRGFAVVADEIRKLAEQTNKETGKIESLIGTIQTSVEKVKESGEEVKIKVEQGLKLSKLAEEGIAKITELTDTNAEDINGIVTSVKEQTTASQEITTAISTITNNSTEIETLSVETSEITKDIKDILFNKQKDIEDNSKLIDELEKDLSFFKI